MNEISGIPIAAISAAGEGAGKEAARTADDLKKERQLKKACRDFEAVFTYYMLKTMRRTVPSGGVIGKVTGQDTYEMLMDQKISEEAAGQAKGLGLQKILFEQLNRGPQK
ncbi:MAG: rod-binding protein [Syntrophales bacterium]|jgi:flagellar protein FlgJ|nr:rod-binding protein [Syntrophales bacterium]